MEDDLGLLLADVSEGSRPGDGLKQQLHGDGGIEAYNVKLEEAFVGSARYCLEPFDGGAGALPLVSFCLLSDGLVGLVEGVL